MQSLLTGPAVEHLRSLTESRAIKLESGEQLTGLRVNLSAILLPSVSVVYRRLIVNQIETVFFQLH